MGKCSLSEVFMSVPSPLLNKAAAAPQPLGVRVGLWALLLAALTSRSMNACATP
jgi:hypothetical protein